MERLYFTREPRTSNEEMLLHALWGEIEEFEQAATMPDADPLSIQIFHTLRDEDMGHWFYTLYEVAERGHAEMFKLLVEKYGLSPRILEEDIARRRAELEQTERENKAKDNPMVIDDAYRYMCVGRHRYRTGSLNEYLHKQRTRVWTELKEMRRQWSGIFQQLKVVSAELTRREARYGSVDPERLAAYTEAYEVWELGFTRFVLMPDSETKARQHQRAKPKINMQYELTIQGGRLEELLVEQKEKCSQLFCKLRGIDDVLAFLESCNEDAPVPV